MRSHPPTQMTRGYINYSHEVAPPLHPFHLSDLSLQDSRQFMPRWSLALLFTEGMAHGSAAWQERKMLSCSWRGRILWHQGYPAGTPSLPLSSLIQIADSSPLIYKWILWSTSISSKWREGINGDHRTLSYSKGLRSCQLEGLSLRKLTN